MRGPAVFPVGGLPGRVTIYEVGPRDGLQNEADTVPTAVKAEFIKRLADCGLSVVEATSFVHPKWVPQLADAAELLDAMVRLPGVRYPVLVPNERGLDRALEAGVEEVAIFGSATETFAQRNLNRSVAESLAMFEPVAARALSAGVRVRGYLSMCFGDPWEGAVPVAQVVSVGARLLEMGCFELSLGDTIGVATPNQVPEVISPVVERAGVERVALHFHDTRGTALANVLAALQMGIRIFDSSAGGLGGCPYAPGAAGNLATETLLYLLDGMGIRTGVDRRKVSEASRFIGGVLPATHEIRSSHE